MVRQRTVLDDEAERPYARGAARTRAGGASSARRGGFRWTGRTAAPTRHAAAVVSAPVRPRPPGRANCCSTYEGGPRGGRETGRRVTSRSAPCACSSHALEPKSCMVEPGTAHAPIACSRASTYRRGSIHTRSREYIGHTAESNVCILSLIQHTCSLLAPSSGASLCTHSRAAPSSSFSHRSRLFRTPPVPNSKLRRSRTVSCPRREVVSSPSAQSPPSLLVSSSLPPAATAALPPSPRAAPPARGSLLLDDGAAGAASPPQLPDDGGAASPYLAYPDAAQRAAQRASDTACQQPSLRASRSRGPQGRCAPPSSRGSRAYEAVLEFHAQAHATRRGAAPLIAGRPLA
eukprot:scaffold67951_cov69-Phaeocystis_antarctica.AAC.6